MKKPSPSVRTSQSQPCVVELTFATEGEAQSFSDLASKLPAGSHYLVSIEEILDGKSRIHHRVLSVDLDDDANAFAELLAATYEGDPEDIDELPRRNERGEYFYDYGFQIVRLSSVVEITGMEAAFLSKFMPHMIADELRHLMPNNSPTPREVPSREG